MRRARVLALAGCLALSACGARSAPGPAPLVLERSIALAGVSGRIDHLAIDPAGRRLFVAELGNGSVEAIVLATGRSLGRIGGLHEPQGLGYLAGRDELVVATGGDGMLRFYRASDLALIGAVKLGQDADDVRVDPQSGRVLVGYGSALAVVDAGTRGLVRSIPLQAHPEGFEVEGGRAFVNLPQAGGLVVVDLAQGREAARWRNPGPHFNFPLALDPDAGLVAAVYRMPAKLVLFSAASGAVKQKLDTCGDADDVFFDRDKKRLYVVCGGGSVDVFSKGRAGYAAMARVSTRRGARTGLFSSQLDRLYVAVRASGNQSAAIWALRPR